MGGQKLAFALLILSALSAHAQSDWLAGGVNIDIVGLTAESYGWVEYDGWEIPSGAGFTGAHSIHDGASGTVKEASIEGSESTPYRGTISAGTVYEHCYQATLSATGSGGASNRYSSGTKCAPAAPGGGNDVMARIVASKLQERWKQAVIVDNKAGANGAIASEFVARAAPDGYTILFGYIATHSGHSTGAALDLTLVDLRADNSAAFDPAKATPTVLRQRRRGRRRGASTWALAMIVPT